LDVDAKMVKYVADLARLKLSDDEISYYQSQLTNIIGYISTLDNAGVDPKFNDPEVIPTIMRTDKVLPTGDTKHSSIKVPRTVG